MVAGHHAGRDRLHVDLRLARRMICGAGRDGTASDHASDRRGGKHQGETPNTAGFRKK
jgi:hypothetical protein